MCRYRSMRKARWYRACRSLPDPPASIDRLWAWQSSWPGIDQRQQRRHLRVRAMALVAAPMMASASKSRSTNEPRACLSSNWACDNRMASVGSYAAERGNAPLRTSARGPKPSTNRSNASSKHHAPGPQVGWVPPASCVQIACAANRCSQLRLDRLQLCRRSTQSASSVRLPVHSRAARAKSLPLPATTTASGTFSRRQSPPRRCSMLAG